MDTQPSPDGGLTIGDGGLTIRLDWIHSCLRSIGPYDWIHSRLRSIGSHYTAAQPPPFDRIAGMEV